MQFILLFAVFTYLINRHCNTHTLRMPRRAVERFIDDPFWRYQKNKCIEEEYGVSCFLDIRGCVSILGTKEAVVVVKVLLPLR